MVVKRILAQAICTWDVARAPHKYHHKGSIYYERGGGGVHYGDPGLIMRF